MHIPTLPSVITPIAPVKKARPRRPRIALVCLECGKRYSVSTSNTDPQCSKCNGVDYEVA